MSSNPNEGAAGGWWESFRGKGEALAEIACVLNKKKNTKKSKRKQKAAAMVSFRDK